MGSRASWKGNLSCKVFGLQVKLITATTDRETIKMNMLHKKDKGRLRQFYKCEVCGEEIKDKATEVIHGYDMDGQYIVITDEEIEGASKERTSKIDAFRFVDPSKIDLLYLDKAYSIIPEKGNEEMYALLLKAMRNKNRVAIGKVVISKKEILVGVHPHFKEGKWLLVARAIRFDNEVKSIDEFSKVLDQISRVQIDEETLKLAEQLIEGLTGDFDITSWKDEYSSILQNIIMMKARGEIIEPLEAKVKELDRKISAIDSLKASVELLKAVNQ